MSLTRNHIYLRSFLKSFLYTFLFFSFLDILIPFKNSENFGTINNFSNLIFMSLFFAIFDQFYRIEKLSALGINRSEVGEIYSAQEVILSIDLEMDEIYNRLSKKRIFTKISLSDSGSRITISKLLNMRMLNCIIENKLINNNYVKVLSVQKKSIDLAIAIRNIKSIRKIKELIHISV